ncbi:hypothetical protein [Alloactinosynnema sp. L-07]|nr:hypothetical protein [Alloactinosynnema sp. L-07]
MSRVRNRLVHPKVPRDEVYHLRGLVADVWLLTRHYVNLLILHWLKYNGSYQTVLGPGGWAGRRSGAVVLRVTATGAGVS